MRELYSSRLSGAGFFVKALGCLLVLFLITTVSIGHAKPISKSTQASSKGKHAKQLRSISSYKFRHVCGSPKRGQAQCAADVVLSSSGTPLTGTPATNAGLGPQQFHTAYNLPCTPGGSVASVCSTPSSFGPDAIAIVDAGNFTGGTAGLVTSMADYDTYYGLPTCSITNGCLNVVNQSGATSPLPSPASGWDDEIVLDIETAHMICQTCKVVLVEANDAYANNLASAEVTAASFNPDSISNSWGSSSDATIYDSSFEHNGIAVVAATGDSGASPGGVSWPADNPNVVAASGSTLQLNVDNTWASESVWSGSGGGCSTYYSAPSWQSSLANWGTAGCGSYRSFGDVSADANPNTGAAINVNGSWLQVGGTSLSSPLIASIFALADGVPSTDVASSVPYVSYSSSNFHDITSGTDCAGSIVTHCTAGTGFDSPSGLGSPDGIKGFQVTLPSQPALTATDVNESQVNLSWTSSSGTYPISGYHIYRNGTLINSVSTTTYNDTGLTPNTTYNYYVVAYDSNGDLSPASSTISALTLYPADINEDGHIDLLDLSILASKYGQCGSGLGRADINGDGCVNLLDLSLLASKYGIE